MDAATKQAEKGERDPGGKHVWAPPAGHQAFGALKYRKSAEVWNTCSGDPSVLFGVNPVRPSITQSRIESYRTCPRRFMYVHRYKIRPKGAPRSKALDVGRFFHVLLAGHYSGDPVEVGVKACGAMIGDINEQAERDASAGFGVDLDAIARDCETNLALARAMAGVFIARYPRVEHMRTISVERRIRVQQYGITRAAWIEGTLDRIVEDTRSGELWIFDPKTCSEAPLERASTCSFELQPKIYRLLARSVFKNRAVVGVVHPIIQKPPIKFCREDRPFKWIEHTLTRGPRKGDIERRKEYLSDVPDFNCYLERVKRWYEGSGEYEMLKAQRQLAGSPPILESWVRFNEPILPPELFVLLHEAGKASAAAPKLHRFPRRAAACRAYGRTCPYLEFCQSDPKLWSEILRDRFEVMDGQVST